MKYVGRIVATSVLSSLLLLSSGSNHVSVAKESFDVNIFNASSFEFREDFVNKKLKNVHADITEIKKSAIKDNNMSTRSKSNTPSVLILDYSKSIDVKDVKELADQYDLVMNIEKVNSKDKDVSIHWFGKNRYGAIVTGTDNIFVDLKGYKKRKNVNKAEVIESKIIAVTKEHLRFINESDKMEEDDQLQTLADYGWKTVDSDQVNDLTPPYGDLYMNFKARKAIDAGKYYATATVTAHIVPGAFLLDEENDEDYEDFETDYAEIRIKGFDEDDNSSTVKMLEHKPLNDGKSGSASYSIGAAAGGLSAGITWEQEWDDLDMEDKSNTYGRWYWDFSGDIEEQIADVTGGVTFKFPTAHDAEIDFRAEVHWTDGWFYDPMEYSWTSDYVKFDF